VLAPFQFRVFMVGVAIIGGALITVITTDIGVSALTGLGVTVILGAGVAVLALAGVEHAFAGFLFAWVPGLGVTVVTDRLDEIACPSVLVAHIVGAQFSVVAQNLLVNAADFRLAGINCAIDEVPAILRQVCAVTGPWLAEVIRTHIGIVACGWRIDTFPGLGITGIDGTSVFIVTKFRVVNVVAIPVFWITFIIGAGIIVFAMEWVFAFTGLGIADLVGANVAIFTILFRVSAVAGVLVAFINSAEVTILTILGDVQAPLIRVATIIGAQNFVITVNIKNLANGRPVDFIGHALVKGTGISIIAIVRVWTLSSFVVTGISRARVMIIAYGNVVASFARITFIDGAFAEVVTIGRQFKVLTVAGLGIALVHCTQVVILTDFHFVDTAQIRGARVCCTLVAVVTVQRNVLTLSGRGITRIRRTEVAVITGFVFIDTFTGNFIAVVHGAVVRILAIFDLMLALGSFGITVIPGTQVIVVAVHIDILAPGYRIAGISCAVIKVIAVSNEVEDFAGPRIAEVFGTGIAIVDIDHFPDAIAGFGITVVGCTLIVIVTNHGLDVAAIFPVFIVVAGVTVVDGTVIIIITRGIVCATTGFRVALIGRTIVVVIAGNQHVVAHSGIFITEIDGAQVVVLAVIPFVDASQLLVTGIDGALYFVVAIHRLMDTVAHITVGSRNIDGAGIPVITTVKELTIPGFRVTNVGCADVIIVALIRIETSGLGVTGIEGAEIFVRAVNQRMAAISSGWVAQILGTQTSIFAGLDLVVAANVLQAPIRSAGIIVITIRGRIGTLARVRITNIVRAHITIFTDKVLVDAGPIGFVAIVHRAGVVVFASFVIVSAQPSGTLAIVNRALAGIVTILGQVQTVTGDSIAGINRAFVVVTAVLGWVGAEPGQVVTVVIGTQLAVTAIYRGVCTVTGFRVARIGGAQIVISTLDRSMRTDHIITIHKAGIHGTAIAVFAERLVVALSGLGIAIVQCAWVLILTILRVIDTFTIQRVAEIVGASVEIVAILDLVGATGCRIARVVGAQVRIYTVDLSIGTLCGLNVAGIDGALVVIITGGDIGAEQSLLVADIFRAVIAIIALVFVIGSSVRITEVQRAGVIVVGIDGVMHAQSGFLVADIRGAVAAVVAILDFINTTGHGIAWIRRAKVAVVAHGHVLTTAGLGIAIICGTEVAIIAAHGLVSTLSGHGKARIRGTTLIVVTIDLRIETGAGCQLASVDGTQTAIVAILGWVLAPFRGVTPIISAKISIVAVEGFVGNVAWGLVASVDRAQIAVLDIDGSELAASGILVARVGRAGVLVVTDNRSMVATNTVVTVSGWALSVIVTGLSGTVIHGAQVPVIARDGCIETLPGNGIALVKRADISIFGTWNRVIEAFAGCGSRLGIRVKITGVQGAEVGVAGIHQRIFTLFIHRHIRLIRAATTDIGEDTTAGCFNALLFGAGVIVIATDVRVNAETGLNIARILGTGQTIVTIFLLVSADTRLGVTGIVGTFIAVIATNGRVIALAVALIALVQGAGIVFQFHVTDHDRIFASQRHIVAIAKGVTGIVCTEITVIAWLQEVIHSLNFVTSINGAGVEVIDINKRVLAVTGCRVTLIGRAELVILTILRKVNAFPQRAGILRTLVEVVTIHARINAEARIHIALFLGTEVIIHTFLGLVDDNSLFVTEVVGAGIIITGIDKQILAPQARVAEVFGTRISVAALNHGVHGRIDTADQGVADVCCALVVVVAGHIFVNPFSGQRLTWINCAIVIIVDVLVDHLTIAGEGIAHGRSAKIIIIITGHKSGWQTLGLFTVALGILFLTLTGIDGTEVAVLAQLVVGLVGFRIPAGCNAVGRRGIHRRVVATHRQVAKILGAVVRIDITAILGNQLAVSGLRIADSDIADISLTGLGSMHALAGQGMTAIIGAGILIIALLGDDLTLAGGRVTGGRLGAGIGQSAIFGFVDARAGIDVTGIKSAEILDLLLGFIFHVVFALVTEVSEQSALAWTYFTWFFIAGFRFKLAERLGQIVGVRIALSDEAIRVLGMLALMRNVLDSQVGVTVIIRTRILVIDVDENIITSAVFTALIIGTDIAVIAILFLVFAEAVFLVDVKITAPIDCARIAIFTFGRIVGPALLLAQFRIHRPIRFVHTAVYDFRIAIIDGADVFVGTISQCRLANKELQVTHVDQAGIPFVAV
jgi:hypothetical protein